MPKPAVVYVIYVDASPEAIWQALIEPEFTAKYWGGRRIESDWAPGSPVRAVRSDGGADWEGEVLVSDPPRLLSYTFHMSMTAAHASDPPSRLTFAIEQAGPAVKLTLTHEHAVPDSATEETTKHGWPAIMSSLKSLLERGEPLPYRGLGFGPANADRPGTL
jgi:uncharacterized protein YndB with AHSA1/START domain